MSLKAFWQRRNTALRFLKRPSVYGPLGAALVTLGVGAIAAVSVRPGPLSSPSQAQGAFYQPSHDASPPSATYARARVLAIDNGSLSVLVLDGMYAQTQQMVAAPAATTLHDGELIVVRDNAPATEAEKGIVYHDVWRLGRLIMLGAVFAALAMVVAGWIGGRSVLGLCISLVIIFGGIIPAILAGHSPILVTALGTIVILCSSTLLSHGLRRRTIIALCAIIVTLLISTGAMYAVTMLLHLGYIDDDLLTLRAAHGQLDVPQLIAASMMIVALGTLDDVATTQVAVVDELQTVARRLSPLQLFVRAMSVGKEHVAALVNTIALTFVGAGFPLAVGIVYTIQEKSMPLALGFNYEYLASEVVRTLVPSMSLLVAVPLSTALAIWLLPHRRAGKKSSQSSKGVA